LHLESQDDRIGILTALFEQIANIDSRDNELRTPLHYAAARGLNRAVDELVRSGTDKNAQNVVGNTPLHDTVSKGHRIIVEALLAASAHVEVRANNGWTPLHVAASNGDVSLLHALLIANANPDANISNLNSTLLHMAVEGPVTRQ
jgi:cytohesin